MEKNSLILQTRIDAPRLDQIEQECFQMIYQQRLNYNERWLSSYLSVFPLSLLRWLGLILSLLGALLCVFYLAYPGTCPKWFFAKAYLLFFGLTGGLFFYLPRLQRRYHAWFRQSGRRASQRLARRMVAGARKQLPYDAKYEITGGVIQYSRGMNGQWKPAWSRKVKGIAIIGPHVSLLFRKPASLIPVMVILSPDQVDMESVFKELGLACSKYSG